MRSLNSKPSLVHTPRSERVGRGSAHRYTQRVLLVRTEGKTYQSGICFDARAVLNEQVLSVDSRDAVARSAESALGLSPSLYFYVGHACPDFGGLVFVFDLGIIASHSGSGSDHDTGGVFAGHIHFDPEKNDEERVAWSRQPSHSWQLSEVEQRTRAFASTHFASLEAYLRGSRAIVADADGRLLHVRNERRAWTSEVRLGEDHALLSGLKLLAMSTPLFEAFRDQVMNAPEAQRSRWQPLLSRRVVRGFAQEILHSSVEDLIASGGL